MKILTTVIVLMHLISSQVSFAEDTIPEKDEGLVGEIRMSLLSEPQFQKLYGPEWVLMKGQTIQGTDLAGYLEKWTTIPDARGLFLRGYNNGSATNPDNTGLGLVQQDQFKAHSHSINRSHFAANASCSRIVTVPSGSGGGHTECADDILKVGETGGNETRPKNLSVNIFIKANHTKQNRATNAVLAEIQNLPQYLIRNRALMSVLDQYINAAIEQRLKK